MSIEEDNFEEVENPTIVDCDLLEAAKENVQPLTTGRRVTALSALLATPHAQRDARLSATRKRLRINVELALDDEDGDPLEAYCQLVNWTLENYPHGHSAESGLLELLEEATRVLKDDRSGKWRRDVKYLKLWLVYASYVEKPTIIYKFLIANDIGSEHALLYEEHAAVLERDGRRKEADEAYALGIARKASPLDHLTGRYIDFQKRMMSNNNLPTPQVEASTSFQTSRPILATTASSSPASLLRRSSPRTTPGNSSGVPITSSNSRIQIFVDPDGSQSNPAEDAANEWNELGTLKTRIKENVPEVKKLAGSKIKQAGRSKRVTSNSSTGVAPSGSKSKIVPFKDPEISSSPVLDGKSKAPAQSFAPFVEEHDSAATVPNTPRFTPFRDESAVSSIASIVPLSESIMKLKKLDKKDSIPTTEAEALRKDPLKNYSPEDLSTLTI